MTDDASDGADGSLVTDDLRVAAVAAACTIGLTIALRYGVGRDVAFVYRVAPLAPYFLSLFAGRAVPDGLDTPRNWSALTVAVAIATFLHFGIR